MSMTDVGALDEWSKPLLPGDDLLARRPGRASLWPGRRRRNGRYDEVEWTTVAREVEPAQVLEVGRERAQRPGLDVGRCGGGEDRRAVEEMLGQQLLPARRGRGRHRDGAVRGIPEVGQPDRRLDHPVLVPPPPRLGLEHIVAEEPPAVSGDDPDGLDA